MNLWETQTFSPCQCPHMGNVGQAPGQPQGDTSQARDILVTLGPGSRKCRQDGGSRPWEDSTVGRGERRTGGHRWERQEGAGHSTFPAASEEPATGAEGKPRRGTRRGQK